MFVLCLHFHAAHLIHTRMARTSHQPSYRLCQRPASPSTELSATYVAYFWSCSLAIQIFVSDYLIPIRHLLVGLNPIRLVAHADRINNLLHCAKNRLSYEYLVRGVEPPLFPWHYDSAWSTSVIYRIVQQPVTRANIMGLHGWQASSFLDHIVTVN
jgi:hypothetical protein